MDKKAEKVVKFDLVEKIVGDFLAFAPDDKQVVMRAGDLRIVLRKVLERNLSYDTRKGEVV